MNKLEKPDPPHLCVSTDRENERRLLGRWVGEVILWMVASSSSHALVAAPLFPSHIFPPTLWLQRSGLKPIVRYCHSFPGAYHKIRLRSIRLRASGGAKLRVSGARACLQVTRPWSSRTSSGPGSTCASEKSARGSRGRLGGAE